MRGKKNPPSNKTAAYIGGALVVAGSLTAFLTADTAIVAIGDICLVVGLVLCFIGYRAK